MSSPPTLLSGPIGIRKLYRDCLRLVQHVAPGASPKSRALRDTIRREFRQERKTEQELEAAQSNAVRALSNYRLLVASNQRQKMKEGDSSFEKLSRASREYHERSVRQARQQQHQQQQQQKEDATPKP